MTPTYCKILAHKQTLKPLRKNLANNLRTYREVLRGHELGTPKELLHYGLIIGSASQILYASLMLDKLIVDGHLKSVDPQP